MTLPVPVVHNATEVETGCAKLSLTGPSVTDDGLTQCNAAVPVGEGVTVGLSGGDGVTVGVPVLVGEGVGVAPPETTVKVNCAPRCVMASLA